MTAERIQHTKDKVALLGLQQSGLQGFFRFIEIEL